MKKQNEANFDLNFGRFKTLSEQKKQELLSKKKAKATNKATKLWLIVFVTI